MKTIILIMAAIGAAIGALSACYRDVPTMVIMAFIGVAFCAPLGAMCYALVSAITRRDAKHHAVSAGCNRMARKMRRCQDCSASISDAWSDYRREFPFYAAGDTDPVAKTLTGWKDASDVAYQRDIVP